MKKFYYILGAIVAATAIFAIIAIMLRKLRVSLCIEGIEDDILDDEMEHDDIALSFEDSDEDFFDDPEIETIISEDAE